MNNKINYMDLVDKKIAILQNHINRYTKMGGRLEYINVDNPQLYEECKHAINLIRKYYGIYIRSVRHLLSMLGYYYSVSDYVFDIEDFDSHEECYKRDIMDSYYEYLESKDLSDGDNYPYLSDDSSYLR